ncbi:tributyrin esterase [Methanobacterium aggregans]|uniref:GltB/FmdC/FwdC-like GXGXG domain-containing protein n=1 Tax=Methanobacterium aggregans TaxID=1615586 RepID=UPI001FDA5045|nr:tributyrin esterase [Methanobacterium aggregans]MBP2046312.1 glutamate synthase domain-containing protein 3 [Methanobacterium aggregans]
MEDIKTMGGVKTLQSKSKITAEGLSTHQLNLEIKKALEPEKKLLLENHGKLDSIAVGLGEDADIILNGDAGDFLGALNDGAHIEVQGHVGRYVGDNMTSGEILINGSAEEGVGFGLCNGTIMVYGDAGNAVGQLNKGGTIIVEGNIGNLAGLYMLSGDIIVTGDAGLDTGDWMIGGTIYVAGNFETGTNAKVKPLEGDDKEKLLKLFTNYSINKDIEDFKKIEPKNLRPFYGKQDDE